MVKTSDVTITTPMSCGSNPVARFNLRHREHSHDEFRPPSTSQSADDFKVMKPRQISRTSLETELSDRKPLLTERDLRADFANGDGSISKMVRTKQAARRIHKECFTNKSWWCRNVRERLPIVETLQNYTLSDSLGDIAAGISVGIASIPMGMSYALLAGLPPAHGLYNNIFYPFIYMLLGSGRQVCVGTSAIENMMSFQAVANVIGYEADPDAWFNATIGLSFLVGLILILFGIFKFGLIARFLADPVISGFSTGSSISIATSQLKHALGLNIPRASTFASWIFVFQHFREIRYECIVITTLGVFLLWAAKFINARWCKKCPLPGSLFVLAIFVLAGYLMKIDKPPFNVKVVGEIPRGFQPPKVFNFDRSLTLSLLQQAAWYSVLYFVIHISIGKTVARQRGYALDASQELIAVGVCSLVGSFFRCFPVATSLSRTSIANVVGAHTTLYNITNCLIIGLTITVMTPLLYYLPMASLSSVVLFGVYFMMSFQEGWRLLKLFSLDFVLWATSCIVTVMWGAMEGVVVSVALSLLWLLKKNAFPMTAVLGRLPGTQIYRNMDRFPMAQEIPGCKIIRFDASLNFSNADQFETCIVKLAQLDGVSHSASRAKKETQCVSEDTAVSNSNMEQTDGVRDEDLIRVVIIDASSINDVDVTAIRMLESLAKRLEMMGRLMLFANWKGPMRDFLDRARFYDVVPPEHCFLSLMDSVQWAQEVYLANRRSHTDQNRMEAVVTRGSTGEMVDTPIGSSPYIPTFRYVTEATGDNTERHWKVICRKEPTYT